MPVKICWRQSRWLATLTTLAFLFALILAGLLRMSWQLTIVALVFAGVLALLLIGLRRIYGGYIETIYASNRRFNEMIGFLLRGIADFFPDAALAAERH